MPNHTEKPRIQTLFSFNLEYFRRANQGVHHYVFETGQFELAYAWMPHELEGSLQYLIERDNISGIITVVHKKEDEAKFLDLGIPVINVSNSIFDHRLHVVTQDDFAAGIQAAEHLLECGCQQFAFWGMKNRRFSKDRFRGFTSRLKGYDVKVGLEEADNYDAKSNHAKIRQFIVDMPPHTGIFVVLDYYAVIFLRAFWETGRRVPQEFSILGSGDDSFYTALGPVPLSSQQFPSFEIGYEAAALLHQLIEKGDSNPKKQFIKLAPIGVIPRRSTEAFHFRDPAVKKVRQHIHEHPGTSIEELVKIASVSRSGLQARFKAAVGCTLLESLQETRMQKAIQLLRTTQLTMEDISEKSGFPSVQRMFAAFRKHNGCTPGKIRANANT